VRYLRPNDLDEAIAAIAAGGMPLAGGSVLVPLIARDALSPAAIVDVGRLAPLTELRDEDGELTVGAAVTLEALARAPAAGEEALAEAAAGVGNPLVRRVGTVGGNVGSGLPTADLAPALLALDATVTWAGSDEDPAPVSHALSGAENGRFFDTVRIRRDPQRRSGFVKFAWREATGAAVVSVAFAASRADGVIASPRLAVGGLVAPARLTRAEAALEGAAWSGAGIDEAADVAAEEAAELAGIDGAGQRPGLVALGVRRLLHRLGEA
jgi:CO/xanthine dehydrogenase FAD-binding subunit